MSTFQYDAKNQYSDKECLALPYAKTLLKVFNKEIVCQIVKGTHPDLTKLANSKIARKNGVNLLLIKIVQHRTKKESNVRLSKKEKYAWDNSVTIAKTKKEMIHKGIIPVECEDQLNEILTPIKTNEEKLYKSILKILPSMEEFNKLPDEDKERIISSLQKCIKNKNLKRLANTVKTVIENHEYMHKGSNIRRTKPVVGGISLKVKD